MNTFIRLKLQLLLFVMFVVCLLLKTSKSGWLAWICLIGSSFVLDFKYVLSFFLKNMTLQSIAFWTIIHLYFQFQLLRYNCLISFSSLCPPQKGNVANQREHLILLLANSHIRQSHKQTLVSQVLASIVIE